MIKLPVQIADPVECLLAVNKYTGEAKQLFDKTFENLIMGNASETLDDGEAATIAYAVEHGAIALLDERKANRICATRFPELGIGCTVDVLAHAAVMGALGGEQLGDAVFDALYHGRMRVLPHHTEWVIDTIGTDRAAQCTSLPLSLRTTSGTGSSAGRPTARPRAFANSPMVTRSGATTLTGPAMG